ncbi:MAG: sigma-70 family RNA polymerase sigma factor, partial [Pseudomonadota bacterium]
TLAEPDETIAGDDPDVETVLTAAEDAKRLRACVEDLPDRQRAVVHLAFFEDMTCAEISTVEGIPEGTVKTRIYHAKKLLMRCLSRCGKKV